MVYKMDDSQSSDIFSDSRISLHNTSIIDTESYDLLLAKIKECSLQNTSEKNDRLAEHFNIILNDCKTCIFQGFDIILSLLEELNVPVDKICNYINDAASILQILSNYIKNVIEVMPITCCKMKTFPTSTGNIISLVFSHCKDSECIYRSYLHDVEKHLKVLFRNCHELQLTYLLALGKNILFDLSENDEQEILLETLDINLKIGEIVQSLDVKTMAEQWKAYTMICEKYSNFLLDKNIYNNCIKLLISTIEDNFKSALEAEDNKILMRSLKVASFSLKILLKMSSIFRGTLSVDYQYVLDLLSNLSLCNSNYYEITSNKSAEFTNLLGSTLVAPVDALTSQLVNEEKFLKLVLTTNINNSKEHNFLAYILLKTAIMRAVLKNNEMLSEIKTKLVVDVFSILPKCHTWFNIGLKLNAKLNGGENQYYGLFEHILIHTITLAGSMTCEGYNKLEKHLYDAVMGLDYYSAVFASNLWLSLCRMSNSQLQLNTLQNILRIYQKLEKHGSFETSPQQINLNYTIEMFFKALKYPEKLLIYKNFNIQDNKNIGIWCALKIRNLPENLEITAERLSIEKLIKLFDEMSTINDSLGAENLIKCMRLTSMCSFVECYPKLEELIVSSWCKACPDCNNSVLHRLKVFKYIEHLNNLTDCYMDNFENSDNFIKIQHAISNIMLKGNTDFIIILFKTFCKLLYQCEDDEVDINPLVKVLKRMEIENDIQNAVFNIILLNEDINDLVTPILTKDRSLANLKCNYEDFKKKFRDPTERRKQFESVAEYVFTHKCIEKDKHMRLKNIKTSGNFDLDIDSLFEVDSEPASKRAKLDTNVETIVSSLENNVQLLAQAKENILSDHKSRIRNVCDNLRNIST